MLPQPALQTGRAICGVCKEEKDAGLFYKRSASRNGLSACCKSCDNERRKKHDQENPHLASARYARYRVTEKRKEVSRRYWQRHAERLRVEIAIRRALMPPEKKREESRRYYESHKDDYPARTAKRRAVKKRAMPPWADKVRIAEKYREAKRLHAETGVKHHVDHIVPLQSNLVCGLHCEANLQVIPYLENHSKGNRHWPDMP